jgi:hypothetical protein
MEPDPELILIPDIAHALAHQCRFGGHTRKFHSVAQHSVRVAELLHTESPDTQLAGLLHDATEAYLVDLPKPIKLKMPNYVEAEDKLMRAISARFDVSEALFSCPEVKDADKASLVIESRVLMSPLHPRFDLTKRDIENASGLTMGECWTPEEAEKHFLNKFGELWARKVGESEA